MLETTLITCPYCGEQIELLLDPSSGATEFIEDCSICCRPIEIRISLDDSGRPCLAGVFREDE